LARRGQEQASLAGPIAELGLREPEEREYSASGRAGGQERSCKDRKGVWHGDSRSRGQELGKTVSHSKVFRSEQLFRGKKK
jgi:hypothetical protein